MISKQVTIVECPRDAMQGWPNMIATPAKIAYLNQLIDVGFDVLDCVSFVSPKAIPQMADSGEVLAELNLQGSSTQLLAIVANLRGGEQAVIFEKVSYVGFPFSISETFQQKNTNSSISGSWERLLDLQNLCTKNDKQLVVYISMGFGNPYGDPYNEDVVTKWIEQMKNHGISIISLADTVGLATPDKVHRITKTTIDAFPSLTLGVHLHSTSQGFTEKIDAALLGGCRRFDGALRGIGGCPMANNDLVGNMDTERLVDYLHANGYTTNINVNLLRAASETAGLVFQ
jgi:hydroxymethylglutaryl-CoA lyase